MNTLPHEKKLRPLGAVGQPDGPTTAELEERRKRQFIIDPQEVAKKDDLRVRKWAHAKISEHENKLTKHQKEGIIIASGDLEPEQIDIRNIYDFKDIHWIIFRKDGALHRGGAKQMLFHIILVAQIPRERGGSGRYNILCKVSFASI